MKVPRILKQKQPSADRIPEGAYCYKLTGKEWKTMNNGHLVTAHGVIYCPHRKWYKTIAGVKVPYCAFLKAYGWQNGLTKKEYDRVEAHLGSRLNDVLKLDLLWDGVKECDQNHWDEIDS